MATNEICICGAGHQGIAMAGHLALNGEKINIWNRTAEHVDEIIKSHKIYCGGIVSGTALINKCSDNIEDVISDTVLITTPSSAHRDIARVIAPFVHKDMVIILNPGRTFGAVDFLKRLQALGVKELPHIAETQTIVYTCRKSSIDRAIIYAFKENVPIACVKGSSLDFIYSQIPACIRKYFVKVNSLGFTSFSNVGMILHCAPVLMNIGWIESEKVDFKYYYDGISKSVAAFLEKLDYERLSVARACGYEIESVSEWLKRTYKVTGSNLYECIKNVEAYKEIDAPPSINCRYIFEDVPNGLVPIEALGNSMGLETPNMTMIINLADVVTNENYRNIGRTYTKIELDKYL